jgi:hypothetical protein
MLLGELLGLFLGREHRTRFHARPGQEQTDPLVRHARAANWGSQHFLMLLAKSGRSQGLPVKLQTA